MIKKIFMALFVVILALGSYFYWQFSAKKSLIVPFPYSFNQNAKKAFEKEIKLAENAKILIVGDQMGEILSNYTPELIDDLAQKFKEPPKIYNWSKPHEGLHRTLFKIKSMKTLPSIIIYHGASSELFEKIFDFKDKEKIFKNFSLFDDEKIISLIITFPWLSKIIYQKMNYFELGLPKEYVNSLAGPQRIVEKEVAFKLFNYELRELIEVTKDKKSNLILITTPINIEVRPKETCSHSTTNNVVELQQEIENLLKEGNFKQAYPKALELSNETFSNAQSFYLLGRANMGLGNLAEARMNLSKASIFDCANWRGNAIYNAIMKSVAKKHQIRLIDFDQYLSSSLSKDGLFIDEIFPQNIFYQTMLKELQVNIKNILSVD